jgi:hypothetical protein
MSVVGHPPRGARRTKGDAALPRRASETADEIAKSRGRFQSPAVEVLELEICGLIAQLEKARSRQARLNERLLSLDRRHALLLRQRDAAVAALEQARARLAPLTERVALLEKSEAVLSRQCEVAMSVLRPEFLQPVAIKRELLLAIFGCTPLTVRQAEILSRTFLALDER